MHGDDIYGGMSIIVCVAEVTAVLGSTPASSLESYFITMLISTTVTFIKNQRKLGLAIGPVIADTMARGVYRLV